MKIAEMKRAEERKGKNAHNSNLCVNGGNYTLTSLLDPKCFIKFTKKQICILMHILFLMLISCERKPEKISPVVTVQSESWVKFVDSVKTLDVFSQAVDSITLYFISKDAPIVLNKIHLSIWKNDTIVKMDNIYDEIDSYLLLNADHIILATTSKKLLYLQEIKFSNMISLRNENVVDYLGDSCKEIEYARLSNNNTKIATLEFKINDLCLNNSLDTSIAYKLFY